MRRSRSAIFPSRIRICADTWMPWPSASAFHSRPSLMTEAKPSHPGSTEVWITGIGLATSLGEGLDANWEALNARRINIDEKGFAPYIVHPLAPVNFDTQIPKKGDQRQMEGWQRIGTYAAGLALDSAAGKSDIALIGGSQNGERKDLLVLYEFGDFNLKDKFAPVWARQSSAGFALGSAGAFLVIESRAHAEARGAKPYARLSNVVADLAHRKHAGEITATLEKLWSKLGKLEAKGAIITGATGAEPVTSEEQAFLGEHPDFAVRATGTMFGHTMETQFPLGLALAALSISRGALFPPNDPMRLEVEMSRPPTQIVVVGAGHWRGEGMALVEAIK